MEGDVRCLQCGLNKSIVFNEGLYYYKVPVGERSLFARTRQDVLHLRDYFESDRSSSSEPEFDFPTVFYQHRRFIVERLNDLLDQTD